MTWNGPAKVLTLLMVSLVMMGGLVLVIYVADSWVIEHLPDLS